MNAVVSDEFSCGTDVVLQCSTEVGPFLRILSQYRDELLTLTAFVQLLYALRLGSDLLRIEF